MRDRDQRRVRRGGRAELAGFVASMRASALSASSAGVTASSHQSCLLRCNLIPNGVGAQMN
jgi:hypothetical protein